MATYSNDQILNMNILDLMKLNEQDLEQAYNILVKEANKRLSAIEKADIQNSSRAYRSVVKQMGGVANPRFKSIRKARKPNGEKKNK